MEKDFVAENAINAITMKARVHHAAQPDLMSKESGYGQVPAYLARVKEEIEAEQEYILHLLDQEQIAAEAAAGSTTRELSGEERDDLLDALKGKWGAVNSKYQVRAGGWVGGRTGGRGGHGMGGVGEGGQGRGGPPNQHTPPRGGLLTPTPSPRGTGSHARSCSPRDPALRPPPPRR